MTPKERMLRALAGEKPDRLPATVHQWQKYHLDTFLGGVSDLEAFGMFGLDASIQYFQDMGQFWLTDADFNRFSTPDWREEVAVLSADPDHRETSGFRRRTPARLCLWLGRRFTRAAEGFGHFFLHSYPHAAQEDGRIQQQYHGVSPAARIQPVIARNSPGIPSGTESSIGWRRPISRRRSSPGCPRSACRM